MTGLTKEQIEAIPTLVSQGHTSQGIATLYRVKIRAIERWKAYLRTHGVLIAAKRGRPSTMG